MIAWFQALSGLQQAFAAAALAGSILFLFQLVLMLVGGHGADAHAPGMEASHDVAHADSDTAFRLLSLQGATTFVMVFGFAGFAMSRGSGYGAVPSLVVAFGLGFAVGQAGRIYLGVKPDVPGKIEVTIQGRLQIFDAVSETGEPLPTDTRVVVVRVESQNVMVVKRAGDAAQKGAE